MYLDNIDMVVVESIVVGIWATIMFAQYKWFKKIEREDKHGAPLTTRSVS